MVSEIAMLKNLVIGVVLATALAVPHPSVGALEDSKGAEGYFADSSWNIDQRMDQRVMQKPPAGSPEVWLPLAPPKVWSPLDCVERCGNARIYRDEQLLTSNAADISPNRVIDLNGHAMSVSGLIVSRSWEPNAFNLDWDFGGVGMPDRYVAGELTLDDGGSHWWSVVSPSVSPDARWLPVEMFRFGFTAPVAQFGSGSRNAIPEPATLELMAVGFAALGYAAHQANVRLEGPPQLCCRGLTHK